jgi:hypothetical protein
MHFATIKVTPKEPRGSSITPPPNKHQYELHRRQQTISHLTTIFTPPAECNNGIPTILNDATWIINFAVDGLAPVAGAPKNSYTSTGVGFGGSCFPPGIFSGRSFSPGICPSAWVTAAATLNGRIKISPSSGTNSVSVLLVTTSGGSSGPVATQLVSGSQSKQPPVLSCQQAALHPLEQPVNSQQHST